MTRRTVLKGPFVMGQDITKSDVETIILLDSFGVDGTKLELTGQEMLWITEWFTDRNDPLSNVTAETRDTRRVVRFYHPEGFDSTSGGVPARLNLTGDQSPVFNPWLTNVEATILTYISKASVSIQLNGGGIAQSNWYECAFRHEDGVGTSSIVASRVQCTLDVEANFLVGYGTVDPAGDAGWYYSKFQMEKGFASFKAKYWPLGEDEPEVWAASLTPQFQPSGRHYLMLSGSFWGVVPAGAAIDVAQISYRTWI